jgi:hypothetical protein
MAIEECPRRSWTIFGCVLEAGSRLASVWRNPCSVTPPGLEEGAHDVRQGSGLQWHAIRPGDDMLGKYAKT